MIWSPKSASVLCIFIFSLIAALPNHAQTHRELPAASWTSFMQYAEDLQSPRIETRLVAIQKIWDLAEIYQQQHEAIALLQAATLDNDPRVANMAKQVTRKLSVSSAL